MYTYAIQCSVKHRVRVGVMTLDGIMEMNAIEAPGVVILGSQRINMQVMSLVMSHCDHQTERRCRFVRTTGKADSITLVP
jgi:hypothetical protein